MQLGQDRVNLGATYSRVTCDRKKNNFYITILLKTQTQFPGLTA